MKYLKTTSANGIYYIEIEECGIVTDWTNWSKCICFPDTDELKYRMLIEKLKKRMEKYWKDKDFVPGKHWYVTTSSPSNIRDLRVIENEIAKKENTNTQPYNYFQTKEEADCLLKFTIKTFAESEIFLKECDKL